MSGDHNMNQTDSGWRKRQIALDVKAENARELGLDYEPVYRREDMKRPIESDYISLTAYTRALEEYCEALAQPEQKEKFCDSNCVWTDHHPDCNLTQPPYRAVKTYHGGKPVYVAEPEQEPVAWMDADGNVSDNNDHNCFSIPLYTTPPAAQTEQDPLLLIQSHRDGFWCIDLTCKKCYGADFRFKHTNSVDKESLTTPPQRTWVGLTNEDMIDCLSESCWDDVVRKAEAKLRSKNT